MQIISCGDSFTVGIGCHDPHVQSYARLVSDHFGSQYVNLAKPGASHFVVYLQSVFATGLAPDLVLLNTTSPDRTEWVLDGVDVRRPLSADQVSYKGFFEGPTYISELPSYAPAIVSDQIHAIGQSHKYPDEPKAKVAQIKEFYTTASDDHIKREYDIGIISLAYQGLKLKGIRCVVLAGILYDPLVNLVDPDDLIHVDFFALSRDYPDTLNTCHCTPEAHEMVSAKIIENITKHLS